jgi:hypothetical protein
MKKRTLVVGWFSWPDNSATFGDVQAMEVVTKWLSDEGFDYDIAGDKINGVNGVSIDDVDSSDYDSFIFVCGPWKGSWKPELLKQFSSCFRIGIDLSVFEGDHGFSLLLAREHGDIKNPDLVFEATSDVVPVIGLALVHPQHEYGDRQRHSQVEEVVLAYLEEEGSAVIRLDTKTKDNDAGISNVSQLEALIRRCDVVISSRLHGMAYSLKNDTPVLAIDCVAGGAKVTAQADALGWPAIINGDGITVDQIRKGVQQAAGLHGLHIGNVKVRASETISKIKSTMIDELKNWRAM